MVSRDKAAPLQPDQIEAGQFGMIAKRHGIGNHVAIDAGQAADHGALADAAELLHRRQAAEDHAVADLATWPPSATELAKVTSSPTMQSWPTWLSAMK